MPIRGQNIGISDYAALANTAIWAAHQTDDTEVAFQHSRDAVAKVEALGGDPFLRLTSERPKGDAYLESERVFTTYGGCGYPNLYEHPHVFKWLLRHRRTDVSDSAGPQAEAQAEAQGEAQGEAQAEAGSNAGSEVEPGTEPKAPPAPQAGDERFR